METFQGKWDTEVLRNGKVYMLEKGKKNYTFNDNNNTPLPNMNIRESILKVMIEDE